MQSKGFYVSELDAEAASRKDGVFKGSIPTVSSKRKQPGTSWAPFCTQSELRKQGPPFWHRGSLDTQRMWK